MSEDARRRLEALGARIERVALDPAAIERQTLFRVARPLYALARWRARVRFSAARALVDAMREHAADARGAKPALDAAIRELEANVDTIERAAILRGRPPVAHAAWLRRVWETVVLADRAIASVERGDVDGEASHRATRVDASVLAPPLTLRAAGEGEGSPKAEAGDDEAPNPFVVDVPTRDEVPELDEDVRVLELELAAIDHLLAAARAETRVLGRKRRLLVAVRQRLLEASAALPLDPVGLALRSEYVAREIARIDRLEAAGLSADIGLVHQARTAAHRGDRRRLYAAMAALDGVASAAGDGPLGSLAGRGLRHLAGGADPMSPEAIAESLAESAVEMLGRDVVVAVESAAEKARDEASRRRGSALDETERRAAQMVLDALPEGAEAELLRASVAIDGCFEVGGALTPVRIVEEDRVLSRVRYPTQDLLLVPAESIEDVSDAIVTDPRTILMDLAAGRLLARRFVREEVRRRTRIQMRSEVRVYLLDGSGSMLGVRARVRDAILVSELATLMARLRAPGDTRCTLFFRYFDEVVGPVTRVDDVEKARAAIRDVVSTPREGGTDIRAALLSSLAQIEAARALEPALARAQVVLVTDGDAPVNEAEIVAAREAIQGLPIGVSVIALGQENPALRGLVARQRAKGEPAFYHFLDDAQLRRLVDGQLDGGPALHLPNLRASGDPEAVARVLEKEVGSLLDELASLERARRRRARAPGRRGPGAARGGARRGRRRRRRPRADRGLAQGPRRAGAAVRALVSAARARGRVRVRAARDPAARGGELGARRRRGDGLRARVGGGGRGPAGGHRARPAGGRDRAARAPAAGRASVARALPRRLARLPRARGARAARRARRGAPRRLRLSARGAARAPWARIGRGALRRPLRWRRRLVGSTRLARARAGALCGCRLVERREAERAARSARGRERAAPVDLEQRRPGVLAREVAERPRRARARHEERAFGGLHEHAVRALGAHGRLRARVVRRDEGDLVPPEGGEPADAGVGWEALGDAVGQAVGRGARGGRGRVHARRHCHPRTIVRLLISRRVARTRG